MIDELLSEADADVGQLDGILALRGPGSFTGLRVGLATCLGFHQALGVPATTLTTFETLASLCPDPELTVLAVVESIRQSWLGQAFRAGDVPEPISEPRLLTDPELAAQDADLLIGFGLTDHPRRPTRGFKGALLDAPPLASQALVLHDRKQDQRWDPSGLVRPLYLQAVSATPPIAAAR
jgi:tRNA threonylcarbamoyl adenosine modification protein YeaZ